MGGTARIARAPFTGNFTSDEFVVNICGKWGVDVDRALAFSPETLKQLKLKDEDLIDMFCAASQLFRIICEQFSTIMAHKDWEKLQKVEP